MIAITHLPQIASQADFHLHVSKSELNGTTVTDVVELDDESRKKEIAKMISSGKLTSAALEQASNMIKNNKG
jgi:DNA repair protein RecN (Recombination protein N)